MIYRFLRGLTRSVVQVYLAGLFKREGVEKVPLTGGLLVCPNHQSTIDPPLVPAFLPRSDSWSMAKSEYFDTGWVAWLFRHYHAFPVVRHTADRKAVKRAFEILAAGQALIVYAEGTRVESGLLQEPEPGAGFLAQKTEAVVLPVALVGTRDCFPKGARWPRRVPVRLVFGRPFRLPRKDAEGRRVSAQDAADAIMLSIAELVPESMRGKFSDLEAIRARVGSLRLYAADHVPLPLAAQGTSPPSGEESPV